MSATSQDASELQDMGELLDSVEPLKPLRRGDVVDGVVMRSDSDGALVNIGHKAEARVPPGEMRTVERGGHAQLKIGDEVVALVVRGETSEEAAILSIDRAVGEQGWRTLAKAMESGGRVKGTVMGFNRGGAIVEAEGVQCFVPMSQLVTISRDNFTEFRRETTQPSSADGSAEDAVKAPEADSREVEATQPEAEEAGAAEAQADDAETAETETADTETADTETGQAGPAKAEAVQTDRKAAEEPSDIGKELELKVLEVNRSRNRAILSERGAIQEQREERKAKLIQELTEGEVRMGTVTGISSFGAFIDLGGADGLVHISELSWNPVASPGEVVRIGQECQVYVLRIDAENNKIALSLKRLQREPWETIADELVVGEIVDATVTKLTAFGAFARLEGSVEGLIHISEMSSSVISHPREVVREGDEVRLKVLRIEPERRRLGLSLRQALDEEGEAY